MVNEHQDGVEKRQAETPELFRPTAQQEAAAAEVEEKVKKGKTRQGRRWEKENPAFPLRIGGEHNEALTAWASNLGATRDEIARGLVGAALEAMDEGWLWLILERTATIKEVCGRTPTGKPTTRQVAVKQMNVRWA